MEWSGAAALVAYRDRLSASRADAAMSSSRAAQDDAQAEPPDPETAATNQMGDAPLVRFELENNFDSQNVCFWSEAEGCYGDVHNS